MRIKTRLLIISIAGVCLFSSVGSAGTYSGGTGEVGNPYQIADVNDILEMSATPADWSKCFILMNDVNMVGHVFIQAVIAPDTNNSTANFQGTQFTGIFDGSGHVVSNLTITASDKDYVGLFGYVGPSGQIKNMGVENANIQGHKYVSGLVGSNSGTLISCLVTGLVSGTSVVGGLVGSNNWFDAIGTLTTCYTTVSISGTENYVGGLVGINSGTLTTCYATGSVSGTGNYVGGLVGANNWLGALTACFWDIQTSGQITSAGGTGKTTAEMKDIQTYLIAGWLFIYGTSTFGDWVMPDNGYPKLAWEVYTQETVPNLKGLTEQEVGEALDAAGLAVGEPYFVYDVSISPRLVSETYPPSGAVVYAGVTPVHLLFAKKTKYAGGDGVSEPYQISDLGNWCEMVNNPADWNRSFILTMDIDLSGSRFAQAPIAPDTDNSTVDFQGTKFIGVFEGDGHTISNLAITDFSKDYIGLFGYVGSGAQIKNLGVQNANIQGRYYVGGLAGENDGGMLSTCYTTGTVNGINLVGGLVGRNSLSTITDCYTMNIVECGIGGDSIVGGLVGQNGKQGLTNRGSSISHCYTTGNIRGEIDSRNSSKIYAGGLIGRNYHSKITACYATGKVTGVGYNAYSSDNRNIVGGLIGQNFTGRISFSYATGETTAIGVMNYNSVGGLVGQNGDTSYDVGGTIYSCHATGDVSGGNNIGGLIGYHKNGAIKSSYALGTVNGYQYVGGLVGYNSWGITTYSFSMSGVTGDTNIGGLMGYHDGGAISSCFATGTVSGNSYAGGFVGRKIFGSITTCYSIGPVTAAGSYVGGFIGRNSDTNTSCFWNTETSGMTTGVGSGSSTGVAGKTTSEMQTLSTFTDAGWDFSITDGNPSIWKMPPEAGYPLLFGQPALISSSYSGGSGTSDDPYQIANVADFQQLTIASGDWSKCFILTADVNLLDLTFTNSPIAPDNDCNNGGFQGIAFSGVFDGNGHTFINLNITASDKDFIGLFGRLNPCGQIKNLGVESSTIYGSAHVGGLVGRNYYGKIISCYTTGHIAGLNFVGGLVGDNIRGVITSCNSSGSVNGESSVGGLVGENACGTILSSFATGDIEATTHSSYSYVGGLVSGNFSGTITSSYASGSVSVTGNDISIGGFIGINYSGAVVSCYSTGDVMGSGASSCFMGGLVGHLSSGTMDSCYSTCNFTTAGDCGALGGLIGENEDGVISSCLWDIETSGITYSAGGKELTTEQMKTLSIYRNAGWTNKGWIMNDGVDYPRLNWENTEGAPIPPAVIPFEGWGTQENPYLISTAQEFALLSWYSGILDKHIKLTNNLDLNGVALYPVGDLGRFTGIFDGNDCTISNVIIHQPGSGCVGLFHTLGSSGEIKNLDVMNISIQGHNYVGGLLGKNDGGTITSCYVTGSIVGSGWYVGAIVGQNKGGSLISSHAGGSVIGAEYVGGLVGDNQGVLTSCFTNNDVLTMGDCIGGLIGKNTGEIDLCYANGVTIGNNYVGGLIGKSFGFRIDSCYSTGSVSGNNCVGGLVGESFFTWINSCYSMASVIGDSNNIGGLVGVNNSYYPISFCYATGSVTGSGSYVGGLVGSNRNSWDGIFTTNFWDTETSGSSNGVGNRDTDPIGVTGKTTVQMKTFSTFTGWDFADTWAICEGTNYPRLQWQIPAGDWLCPDGAALEDYAFLAGRWLLDNCDPTNEYCQGADLDASGSVDLDDILIFADTWLEGI